MKQIFYLIAAVMILMTGIMVGAQWRDIGNGNYEKVVKKEVVNKDAIQKEITELTNSIRTFEENEESYKQGCVIECVESCNNDYDNYHDSLQGSKQYRENLLKELK